MNRLAICVPTYNRAEMIEEMLIRCGKLYQSKEIDVYFYDSSKDERTQRILDHYSQIYNNLFYRKVPSSTHSNIKVLNIYEEFSKDKKYEYLSICPDYMQFSKAGIDTIEEECEKGFDLCVLNFQDVEHIGRKVYTDINEVFLDCAWQMTCYVSTIVYLPFLEDTDWDGIRRCYTVPERINHSHVALFFEQLSKKEKIKAVHVPISLKHISSSSYRKDSYWKEDTFSVWCEYWPAMIQALPKCYHNKNQVIRKLGINSKILSLDNYVKLRKEGIYNRRIYKKYCFKWKELTDVSRGLLWLVAIVPSNWVWVFSLREWKRRIITRRLIKYCRKHKDIYIYGCGFIANKLTHLLDELQIHYCAYIVSDRSNEKRQYNGLDIVSCQDFCRSVQKAGVILALRKENAIQVIQEKRELKKYPLFYMGDYADVLE